MTFSKSQLSIRPSKQHQVPALPSLIENNLELSNSTLLSLTEAGSYFASPPTSSNSGITILALDWARNTNSNQYICLAGYVVPPPPIGTFQSFNLKNTIQIWQVTPTLKCVMVICTDNGAIFNLDFSPGKFISLGLLSVCFGDGSSHLYNIPTPPDELTYMKLTPLRILSKNSALLWTQAWQTETIILHGCTMGMIQIYDLTSTSPIYTIQIHDLAIRSISINPSNQNLLCTSSNDGKILITDLRDSCIPYPIYKSTNPILSVNWSIENGICFNDENISRFILLDNFILDYKEMSCSPSSFGISAFDSIATSIDSSLFFQFAVAGGFDGSLKVTNLYRTGNRHHVFIFNLEI